MFVCLSARLSVCPSHAGIVLKKVNLIHTYNAEIYTHKITLCYYDH